MRTSPRKDLDLTSSSVKNVETCASSAQSSQNQPVKVFQIRGWAQIEEKYQTCGGTAALQRN